jgi:N-methylhydantoinase A
MASPEPSSYRLGVDVGGTFTDLIVRDDATGAVLVGKELSSADAPDDAVLRAIEATLGDGGLARAAVFVHGTTVGLNALLERRGATVGLLATSGFRDVLEVRRGDRDDPYDLFWRPPAPLVPRRLRLPVTERVLADGTVRVALVADDVAAALDAFRAEGVDAIAVAFMNAYANPAHELEAERLLRAAGFDGPISLSHRISGEYREYERTCTTVIDAFVRRRMGGYLERLQHRLGSAGFAGSSFMTRSGGGAMTFEEAAERPFETIMSGPVAGVAATVGLARDLGLDGDLIAADVGGTSFDTCVIADGRAPLLYQGEIVGLPLQAPWVDVRSIGAGGGSIAMVDAGGLLRVGPRSAGASPGPACYGRGGTEPTVTDAALALGMLPDGAIAGDVTLRRELAEAALEPLAERAGLGSVEAAARGILQIAAAHMADAIRGITVEQGRDPRTAALVPFGGAGGIFGTLVAAELGVDPDALT